MVSYTGLLMNIARPKGRTNLPILVLMHGWNQSYTAFDRTVLERFANYGFFVIAPGMRGNNAGAGRDASARELYDVYDAIIRIRTVSPYSQYVNADKVAVCGYSGGGGNALGLACKFPDLFNVVVSYFGMSDYGRNEMYGWYQNNGGTYTASISTSVGGTPLAKPDNYYARDATSAIQNFSGGFLYLYHDKQDSIVPWVHSDRIKTSMDNVGYTNYSANFSDVGDSIRFLHGLPIPSESPGSIVVEPIWTDKILSHDVWTVSTNGTLTVIGYCKTKRFEIRLNKNGTAEFGLDAVATVNYNVTTNEYIIIPITSGIDVSITQGLKSGFATNINVETAITVT